MFVQWLQIGKLNHEYNQLQGSGVKCSTWHERRCSEHACFVNSYHGHVQIESESVLLLPIYNVHDGRSVILSYFWGEPSITVG